MGGAGIDASGSAGGAAEATGRQRARAAINMIQSPGSGSKMSKRLLSCLVLSLAWRAVAIMKSADMVRIAACADRIIASGGDATVGPEVREKIRNFCERLLLPYGLFRW
jgi:hypothetical protein